MATFQRTLLYSLGATSAMTLFSYVISEKQSENFKEPKLLGDFVKKSSGFTPSASESLGWMIHYLTGVGFTIPYESLLKITKQKSDIKSGLVYGALAGGVGIIAWSILLRNHHCPPKIDQKRFYAQLAIAHVIFGLTLSLLKKSQHG